MQCAIKIQSNFKPLYRVYLMYVVYIPTCMLYNIHYASPNGSNKTEALIFLVNIYDTQKYMALIALM